MKKKILSIFLSIVLCLTLMPTTVFADYEDGVECEYCGAWRYDDWLCDDGNHCAVGYGCGDEHHCPSCGACEENVIMCPTCNNFCSECDEWCDYHEMCTECAIDYGDIHCSICGACGDEIDLCDSCGLCDDCGQDEGFHCKAGCGVCIEDGVEMCDNCGMCYDCGGECSEGTDHLCLACHFDGVSNGACTDCGKCFIDDDSQKCLLCGRCFDCGGKCESDCEDACLECHVDSGNACPDCGKCFMDDESQKCLLCGRCFDCGGQCASNCEDACLDCHLDNDVACPDCGKCFMDDDSAKCDICGYCNECEEWCDNCMMHVNCAIDEGKHCPECAECGSNVTICPECGDVCSACADWCDNCNMCVECAINKGLHCQNCEECGEDVIICENCGEFCNSCADFCDSCEMCMVCAVTVGVHCPNCEACGVDDVTICQECKDVCSDCADNWCDTCEMCFECAIGNELHCEECGNCFTDAERCPTCGLCEECCNVNTTPKRIINVSVNGLANKAVAYAYDYDSFTVAYDWNDNYNYQGKTPVVGDVTYDWSFYILGEDGYPVDAGKTDLVIKGKSTITSDDISSLKKNERYLVWVNVSNNIVVHGSEKSTTSFTQFYIDTLEHNFTIVKSAQVNATCTTDGKTAVMQCEDCGKLTGGETIPATGHKTTTNVTKATTSKNGKITYNCSACGVTTKASTTVYYPKTITLSATKYTYDGNAKKPTVKVVDSNGKAVDSSNYTVTYASGRKNVGKYTVKIVFKGNYSGTVSKSFTIVPKSTTISSLTAASKGFTVKWKKQATQTTGYQIQYSTSSSFSSPKTVTVTSNSTVSKKITKLTAKKKYYVRIRTYKTVSGTKYYSSWSNSKSVTTKK